MMPPPQQDQSSSVLRHVPGNGQAPQQTPPQGTSKAEAGERRWDENTAFAALQQAIQSSPARVLGAQTSPIEVRDDLTPKPTRRLLFPSPRKSGEFKSLDEISSQKSTTTSPSALPITPGQPTPAQDDEEADQVDKENLPPPDDDNDDFADLFDDSVMPSTPGKITPNTARSIAHILKTPTPLKSRTPRTGSKRRATDHLESPTRSRVRRTPSSTNPKDQDDKGKETTPLKPMTPFTASLTQFLSDGFTASSPSRVFQWGIRSSPNTRSGGFNFNNDHHDIFSAGYPGLPSSPPLMGRTFDDTATFDLPPFDMYEDQTATEPFGGGWADGLFGVEIVEEADEEGNRDSDGEADRRSSQSEGVGLDLVGMVEGLGN
jgi:hypothetical protein